METFKATTNKLSSSRLLKLTLIGIGTLLFIKLLSYAIVIYILHLTSNNTNVEQIRIYSNIIDIINIPVATSISAIIVAVIGRYGIREGMSHLNSKPKES